MKILYFSWLKDKVGKEEELVTLPKEINTVRKLILWLESSSEGHKAAFEDLSLVRVAINMETALLDEKISSKDEIAFFPPMTGG